MRNGLIGLLLLVLWGCVGGTPPPVPVVEAEAPTPSVAELRESAAPLPGVEVDPGERLILRYPGERLFSAGAALPLAGGVEMLEPLADWLAASGRAHWRGTVRAATDVSPEYDRQLAGARAELLGRYFVNRGIAGEKLELKAEGGDGAPFELELRE